MVENLTQFWMKLFPEVDEEGFDKISNAITNTTICKLADEFKNESLNVKYRQSKYFSKFKTDLIYGNFIQNFLSEELPRLEQGIKECDFILNPNQFCMDILGQLADKLFLTCFKTIIRYQDKCRLEGKNDKEKFNYFNQVVLKDPNFLETFYEENPALILGLENEVKKYINFILLVLKQYEEVKQEVSRTFGLQKNEKLEKIHIGKGDTHQNGKSVCILQFKRSRVVYKPRSLGVDLAFQRFLQFINKKTGSQMKTVMFLDYEAFGFMEFVESDSCENEDDVVNFYDEIGKLLSIIYILNGNDMHFENVIAAGGHPVLIDLESLLAPRVRARYTDEDISLEKAFELLETSISGIALLPTEVLGKKNHMMDLGGISTDKDQISPYKSMIISGIKTGKIDYQLGYSQVESKNNIPTLEGKIIHSTDYKDVIEDSFIRSYKWFCENKKDVIEVVERLFKNKRVRYLNRSTMVYSKLLQMSTYPIFSVSNVNKKVLFHRIGIGFKEKDIPFLQAEYEDLFNSDVPFFQANTSEINVYDSRGIQIPDVLKCTPLSYCIDKINMLSEEDLEEQLRLFQMTFLNKRDSKEDTTNIVFLKGKHHLNYIEKAEEIGKYLIRKSISEGDTVYWIAPTIDMINQSKNWSAGVLSYDIYNGSAGIAIFLSYLYAVTKKKEYKNCAQKVINGLIVYIEKLGKANLNDNYMGTFVGLSAYFYTIQKCSEYLEEPRYMEIFNQNIHYLKALMEQKGEDIDYLYGATGVVHFLCNMKNKYADQNSIQSLIQYSGSLLTAADIGKQNLSGFAHGVSSLLSSFALLYKKTGENCYLEKAKECIDYIFEFYSEDENEWYNSKEENDISYGFCHGAPGILLAFTICKECNIDLPKDIIEGLTQFVKNKCFGRNITLCHGDMGNFEILRKYSEVFSDEDMIKDISYSYNLLYQTIIENILKNRLSHSYAYGIMLGLSGVGISLLNNVDEMVTRTNILWLD